MERRRGNGKVQYQGKGQHWKRFLTFMLAIMVIFTSIPLNMAWADELSFSERPGDDEIVLDGSVEDGDLSDINVDISHTIAKKGDKAAVTVSAVPSESGQENGVTKVTKVEIHQNGKLKKGKRFDDKWEFTVKENGVYSFVIYYNSKDGEDMMVASPSEVEKIESTTEAEPQKPGGTAGGASGGGTELPEETSDQEVTMPETEEDTSGETTGDNNTEEDKKNDGTVEGDSSQDTSNQPEQKPSDNPDSDGKEEGKGDSADNQGGADSSEQGGSSDNSTGGSDNNTSTEKENSDSSNSSDNNSDTSSNGNSDSSSSNDSGSGSTDNSGSDSSGSNGSGSSDGGNSDSSGSSSGSSDSGSSDNSGGDEGSDSVGTSIALNVIDFIFPVIEAQASDFTVKKAVIVEYEITNLFPEGNPEDVDVDVFDELTEEGAMITLLVEPSEIGLDKGVREITDISLIDFELEDDSEVIDSEENRIATDSEAEEETIEEKEEIKEASPSEATYNTTKSSSAKHAEYQASESDENEYRFFVKANGTYTFSIRYGRVADLDFEDSAEVIETQFSMTYDLDSITKQEVRFLGVEDVVIEIGQPFDLMEGVQAVSGYEKSLLDVTVESDDAFAFDKVGDYKITYAAWEDQSVPVGYYERSVSVRTSDIEINETNFPDANFRELVRAYDTDNNGFLSKEELNAVKSMEVMGYPPEGSYIEYNSVKGIEYFTALESLIIKNTNITELDLSNNSLLETLHGEIIHLEHDLDINNLTNLRNLELPNIWTATGKLDLSNNVRLEKLQWGDPLTTSIDLSNNLELTEISITGNAITELNTRNNSKLNSVSLNCRNLKEIDLSTASQLTSLSCCGIKESSIPPILSNRYKKYELNSLKLNPEVQLRMFFCNDTKLEELEINTDNLMQFNAGNCEFKSIIMYPRTRVMVTTQFDVSGNRLPYLDLEQVQYIYDFRTGKSQKVSGYYVKNTLDDTWVFDMKQLVGSERTRRINLVETDDIESYNLNTGILTLSSLPEAETISYQYDMKAPNGTPRNKRLDVDVKLKPVEVSSEKIIYVTNAQAQDENYIKKMIHTSGTYGGESGESMDIQESDFRYHFNKEGESIKSVDITAVMDNGWETPIMATTKVAILPSIEGNNIILYEGETYSRDKLHIAIDTEKFKANTLIVDDAHVNTNQAGTYQIKVTQELVTGISVEKYLYVQVVGKTKFAPISDIHTRKGEKITQEQIMAEVSAAYEKPMDIPDQPWEDSDKVNGGQPSIKTEVEVTVLDTVNTSTVGKDKLNYHAPGMIHGREMTGKAETERYIYIHGLPVIVAYDNGISTHQSTDSTVLEQAVRTGLGTLKQNAASAYVEYVQPDGSIQKVVINPDKITYTVNQFVPLTVGEYLVHAKVDDSSVLILAQAPDLTFAEGEKEAKVVVADKMYTVSFETGDNGSFENPDDSMTVVTHGSKVAAPAVVLKEGYIFSGWLDEEGNRVASVSDIVITSDCTFTAEIKLKEFTVRFIGKNGNVISTQIVKYGADANPPTDHADVKDGRFIGWDESYTNITKNKDIHAKYRSNSGGSGGSEGGGPSGGDRYVPSGPGDANTTTMITGPNVPKSPFENLVTIGTNPVPTGNMDIPVFTGLPKTGDVSVGSKAGIGYQATLIDGTVALSEEEPLVGHQNGGFIHAFEDHADWRKCILHIILLIISALEGIFYLFKHRKDKRLLEKLRKELEEEEN